MNKFMMVAVVCVAWLGKCVASNIYIPEYIDQDLNVKCMAFNVDVAPLFERISHLSPVEKEPCNVGLKNTLEKMKKANTAEEIHDVASDLTSLSNVFSQKQKETLEDIFLNLFFRAALKRNIGAMFGIVGISFCTSEDRLSKIFAIKDVKLNFYELQEMLESELDESESPEAFRKVIQKLTHAS